MGAVRGVQGRGPAPWDTMMATARPPPSGQTFRMTAPGAASTQA